MKDQKHSQLKVGSPTHYNNQKQPEKAPEQINVHTAAEGVLAYVHPALHERLKEENAQLRRIAEKISKESVNLKHMVDNPDISDTAVDFVYDLIISSREALQQEGGRNADGKSN